ncbi:MAG: IS110 family transposase [Fimbriimonas sp.]
MESVHHPLPYLGVDVGKSELVVCLLLGPSKKTKAFSNDKEGVKRLLEWLGEAARTCRAVLEATSRYHRLCERALWDAGARVELVNPRRARSLAIGLGHSDKNDKVDAHALARSARLLEEEERSLASLAAQDLRDHSRAIDALKKDAADCKKRMEGLDPASAAYKLCEKAAREMKKIAEKEEKAWRKGVKEDPETLRRYELALSVPDVGEVTARIVSVELPPDLGRFSLRELLAYAGLVPRTCQSGGYEAPPAIFGGNAHLRTGLFMATLHAAFRGGRFREKYDLLKARPHVLVRNEGGRHMKAMVALMRKLLGNVLAVIRRDSPWQENPPRRAEEGAAPPAPESTGENAPENLNP